MATKKTREEIFNDYDGFVDKFKPKKTTDDCYTPEPVYNTVKQWVNDNILPLDGVEIVRPFWPGGDYEKFDYPEGCVVLDNPPFSILAKIRRFYHSRNIKYFLFCHGMTIANSARELDSTYIICGRHIVYENGAGVPSGFVTNLDCGDKRIWVSGDLTEKLKSIQDKSKERKNLPEYDFPDNVVSPARLRKIAGRGIDLIISKRDSVSITALDSQRQVKKGIYGGGWLISDKAAAEKAAAEKAAAEKAAAQEILYWGLSEREKEIIRNMR